MATLMLDAPKAQFEWTVDGSVTVVFHLRQPIPYGAWPSFSAVLRTPSGGAPITLPIELMRTVRIPGVCELQGQGWMEEVDPETGRVNGIRHILNFKDGRQLALTISLAFTKEEGPGVEDDDDALMDAEFIGQMVENDSGDEMDDDDRAQYLD